MTKTNTNEIRNNATAALGEIFSRFDEARTNARVFAGETKEDFMSRCDESINVMHGAFYSFLDLLDTITGYQGVKNSIAYIMETEAGTSKKSLKRVYRRTMEVLDAKIKFWSLRSDSPEFKKAVQLKAVLEMENDKGQSVLSAYISGLLWIAKKVARKLRSWLKIDDENSVIGAICRSFSGFAKVVKSGIDILWNVGKFGVAFLLTGVLWCVDLVCKAFTYLVNKVKGWIAVAQNKLASKDEDEDLSDEAIADEEDCFLTEGE